MLKKHGSSAISFDKSRRTRRDAADPPLQPRRSLRETNIARRTTGGATASRTAPARVTKASAPKTLHQTGGEVPNQTTTWKASRKETTNPATAWKASHEGMKNMPKIRNGPGGGMGDPRTGGTVHCT